MALADSTNPMQGVSGPGKFAKRTDLKFQPQEYGQGVEMAALKAGAPLAQAPKSPMLSQAPTVSAQEPITSLYASSQRPDEPITHGVDIGPGAGASALAMHDPVAGQYQNAYELIQQLAANPDASPTLQYLAQRIQQGF